MGARGPTSSKGTLAGQGEPLTARAVNGAAPVARALRALVVGGSLLALAACGGGESEGESGRPTPSGFPVPRYLTLKFDTVNARAGPGDDHQVLWVYHARGLPVQVIAETREWRRICDPDGGVAWVHRRVTDGGRNVIRLGETPLPLRRRPQDGAEVSAYLNVRALAALDRCEDGWCRLTVGQVGGWAPQSEVWGAGEGAQCR